MLELKSDRVSVNATQEVVFKFLCDLNNYKFLMPDSVSDWQSEVGHCTFKISGMYTIGLQMAHSEPNNKIKLNHFGKVPFNYTLDISIEASSDGKSECMMMFNGEVNPFMQMMVEKPLSNFFNYLAHKLHKHFENHL